MLSGPGGCTRAWNRLKVLSRTNTTAADAEFKMKKTTLIPITLLSLTASLAFAEDRGFVAHDRGAFANDRDAIAHDWDDHRCHGDSRWCVSAPEIDPAQAMGALALLGGTVAIVRGYRRRKK